MLIQVCVGSSCHLKGSHEIVELLQGKIAEENIDAEVTLAGSFCAGKCNRDGVTVAVDDVIYTGITKGKFDRFFDGKILLPLNSERK